MSETLTASALLAPGLRKGLPFSEYHALDALSHSKLEPYKRTPAHAREAMLHPKEPTEALALGHAFHEFVLEEPEFLSHYVVPPKVDRRTTIGKATWAEFQTLNPGKALLASEEMDQYNRMRDSIMAHPVASEWVIKAAAREVSFVWHETVELSDGSMRTVACKGREDILTPYGGYMWIVNLKTTRDASDRSFSRDISKYGYGRASAWYRRGLAAAVKQASDRRVAYIAVEKDSPFCVACYELDERAINQGEREMLKYLALHLECEASGRFPGYDQGLGLLDLPAWDVDTLDQ